eukprot:1150370-Pelagomonas_calceolata.AAC.9
MGRAPPLLFSEDRMPLHMGGLCSLWVVAHRKKGRLVSFFTPGYGQQTGNCKRAEPGSFSYGALGSGALLHFIGGCHECNECHECQHAAAPGKPGAAGHCIIFHWLEGQDAACRCCRGTQEQPGIAHYFILAGGPACCACCIVSS